MRLPLFYRCMVSIPFFMLMSGSPSQSGVVTILGGEIKAGVKNNINNFYNSLDGHSSSIATGDLNTVNLTSTDLLWLTEPRTDFTPAELAAMAEFLASGGRIAFMGEHGQVAQEQNVRINTALSFLGSTIRINATAALDDNFRSASVADGQILSHPLTAGVDSYEYGWFAPLTISGTAQALMLGEEPFSGNPSVMMGFQNIGSGTVFVIADQSMWDSAAFSWPGGYDNPRLFENLLIGATSTLPALNAKIVLSPATDTNIVTTGDTLIAAASDFSGKPLIGQRIIFNIISGPNTGLKDTGVTGSSGNAVFIYRGNTTGLDEIIATMQFDADSQTSSNHAFHLWKEAPSTDPIADAGPDSIVPAGLSCEADVVLDGTGSTDPDGGAIVSYSWRLPSGRTVTGDKPAVRFAAGIHKIILTVTDDEGAADYDTIIVTITVRKTALSGLADTIIDEGTILRRGFTATGGSGTPPHISVSSLPAGALISDSGNGAALLTWSTGCNSHGTYTIVITAIDTAGACRDSVGGSFTLIVRDVNSAPVFFAQSDTTISENQNFFLTFKVQDCNGDVPEINAVSIPSGATLSDRRNRTADLEWTAGAVDSGNHRVIIEARDGGSVVRDTIFIRVVGAVTASPVQLLDGFYVDENGDGRVEAVYLQFNDEAPIGQLSVTLDWAGTHPERLKLSGASLSFRAGDHRTVHVAVPDSAQSANGIRTSGIMTATVLFTSSGEEQQPVEVRDNAAPVIDSAICRVGTSTNPDQPTTDTLHVWFSESISIGTAPAPFTFISETRPAVSPALSLLFHKDNYAVFTINGTSNFIDPKNNDSLFINPVSAVGDSHTWQNNPANRRVRLLWDSGTMVSIIPITVYGKDPMDISAISARFGIRETSGKIILIDSRVPLDSLRHEGEVEFDQKDGKPVFGKTFIYDPVGNLTCAGLPIKKAVTGRWYYVLWDGTNRNHRRVSEGPYLIRISYSTDSAPEKKSKKFMVRWR